MSEAQESAPDSREQRAFLAHARHELRTPLNAILGYSDIILEDGGDPELLADVRRIHAAGRRLLELINEILDPGWIESTADINLDELAARIRYELRTPLDTVIGCSELLLEDSNEFAAELRKIDDAARRLLAMSENIIQLSVPGTGQAAEPQRSLAGQVVQSIPSLESSPLSETAGGTILVADDSETNRDLLTRRLERQGYAVTAVENGRMALESMRANPPDLLLLDVIMPEMNGYETLRTMKSDPELRHIPVIMISSLDELDSIVRCIEMGAEDYLPKTFDPVLLKARIGASLEKKRLRDREVELFRQLEANFRRLQELEALRDSLTHMVVHDLRTPLTALLTGLQTMPYMGEMTPDQSELLEMSIQGGKTLLGMINDLLDISKMEDGSLQLEREQIDPASLADEALLQVGMLAAEKSITLERQLPDGIPAFTGDSDKLRRTLVNLLGNAVKFTPDGGRITLAAASEGGWIRFSVSDTGEGIPKEAFGRIFEKFGQVETRKAGRKMSTGLGLTFCKMVAEAHGGRIWVESGPGQGSTFSFEIPA